jgi:hypothetical protein
MRAGSWRRTVNVAGVIVCILGAFFAIGALRRQWIDYKAHEHRLHLFKQASFSGEWTGSDGEMRAIRELGADPSDEAKRMLVDLASHPSGLTVDPQRQAISELAKRNDQTISPFLASLIQPGTLLDSRMAAAEALQSMPCNDQCTKALLSYLNRIDSGELNAEQQGLDVLTNANLRESVEAMSKRKEQKIYELVYVVLLRSPDTTNSVLTQDYGLGTATPKQFAIAFVTRANSSAFCPALIQSERQLSSSTTSIRTSVTEALNSMKCREAK